MTRNTKSKQNKNMVAEIENKNQETKRRGRPRTKTEDDKQINIRIPLSVIKQLEDIKPAFGDNLTRYINILIEKDLKENYEKYLNIIEMLDK